MLCEGAELVVLWAWLWVLLPHLLLPLGPEGVPVLLADVVEDAAGQHHGGHHVKAAVVPLAEALPAGPQPQQGPLAHPQGPFQVEVETVLGRAQYGRSGPAPLPVREGGEEPALEGVTGLTHKHVS